MVLIIASIISHLPLSMAFARLVIALAIVAAMAQVNPISAKDITVGDESGWRLNFDYQAWVQGKEFNVGDRLIFNYTQGRHSVVRVDGAGFRECAVPNGAVHLTSGNDVITLAAPGNERYICGVPNHCAAGMKLAIIVSPNGSPATSPPSQSPSPVSAAHTEMAPRLFASMVAALGVLFSMI